MTREEKIKKKAEARMKLIKELKSLRPDFDFSAFNTHKKNAYSVIKCDKGHEFRCSYYAFKSKPICRCCNNNAKAKSLEENEIIEYLNKRGIKTIQSYRCIEGPNTFLNKIGNLVNLLEIDVYLPQFNIGIEFNDSRGHTDNVIIKRFKGYFNSVEEYHNYKTYKSELLGIKLIHIFEKDYYNRKDELLDSIFNICLENANKPI